MAIMKPTEYAQKEVQGEHSYMESKFRMNTKNFSYVAI